MASSLAKDVQELSMTFRKAQSNYLKRLQNRDNRNKGYGVDESAGAADEPEEMISVDDGYV